MLVRVIHTVVGALETFLRELEHLKIGGRIETIQITAMLRTVRILGKVQVIQRDLLSIRLSI